MVRSSCVAKQRARDFAQLISRASFRLGATRFEPIRSDASRCSRCAIRGADHAPRRGPRLEFGEQFVARSDFLFTSESVSEGHPDKVADRISDEIVDLFYREGEKAGIDPFQIRVAAETLVTTNRVVIAGEVRGPDDFAQADRGGRPQGDQGHWLRAGRFPLGHRGNRNPASRAIGRYRPGRRRRRQQGRRRGRPGHHVRLCVQRDGRSDAGAAPLRAQDSGNLSPRPASPAKAMRSSSAPTPRAR